MSREERKKRLTQQRESQILEAALVVFSEKGFGAATIPDIASKAGLAVGSLYNYFPNKRELFVGVIRSYVLNAPLLELIDDISSENLEDSFIKIIKNRLELTNNEHVAHMPVLMAEIQRDEELRELWYRDMLQPFFQHLEETYSKITEIDNGNTPGLTAKVRMIGATIIGFVLLKMVEGKYSPLNTMDNDELAGYIVDYLLFGLTGKRN